VPSGTPVRATADGELSGAAMGAVVLNYGHDVMRAYGHLLAIAVLAAQHVTLGQVIGDVGQTGRATDPHLHLEAQMNNVGEFEPVSADRLCAGDKLAGNQSGS
jgi:murein DD-endopeptidase MepM/ murein hydrolase activator NlpD